MIAARFTPTPHRPLPEHSENAGAAHGAPASPAGTSVDRPPHIADQGGSGRVRYRRWPILSVPCLASAGQPSERPSPTKGSLEAVVEPNACRVCGAHGLRHTHAGQLAMEGKPVNLIQAHLGHASFAVTSTYLAHIAPAQLIEAMRSRPAFSV